MRSAYHYTTERGWGKIKEECVLKPRSRILSSGWKIPKDCAIPGGLYTFALLDTWAPPSWEESGFLDRLILKMWAGESLQRGLLYNLITLGGIFGPQPKYAILEFPIVDEDKTWVLDSGKMLPDPQLARREQEAARLRAYLDSMVPLKQYVGGYMLPEVAITTDIPVEQIHVVKIEEAKLKRT